MLAQCVSGQNSIKIHQQELQVQRNAAPVSAWPRWALFCVSYSHVRWVLTINCQTNEAETQSASEMAKMFNVTQNCCWVTEFFQYKSSNSNKMTWAAEKEAKRLFWCTAAAVPECVTEQCKAPGSNLLQGDSHTPDGVLEFLMASAPSRLMYFWGAGGGVFGLNLSNAR